MKYLIRLLFAITLGVAPFIANAQLFEDFELGDKSAYAFGYDILETGEWAFDDALIGTLANDKKNGAKSVRIRNSGYLEMNFDYPNGMLELSFYAANYGTNTGGAVLVSYSTNGGANWTPFGDAITLGAALTQYTFSQPVSGNIRLKFEKTSGDRINIDDVQIIDYVETIEDPTLALQVNELEYGNESTFDFGMNTGQATATLTLRNIGEQDLIISSYTLEG